MATILCPRARVHVCVCVCAHAGKLSLDERGRYQRPCLVLDEALCLRSHEYIKRKLQKKGKGNFTVSNFQYFVNDRSRHGLTWIESTQRGMSDKEIYDLGRVVLPISFSTACLWLHKLGYCFRLISKNIYFDG